jgi:hypothetical protein
MLFCTAVVFLFFCKKESTFDLAGTAVLIWLGWAYLTKKVPHAATTPIATAFKICVSHRKNGLLNRLLTKVSFFDF